jgi:alpha/beta hydrolase fold
MRIDFIPDPALYPFTSRWFDSSRGRVHYVDEGSGPVIMFFHGNPTWSFLYRYIVTGLRDQFRCIAADYLGFGLSERPSGFSYRIEEHAQVMGELVDHLDLDGYLTMARTGADRSAWPSTSPVQAGCVVSCSATAGFGLRRICRRRRCADSSRDGDPAQRRRHGALPQGATHAGGPRRHGTHAKGDPGGWAAARQAGP